MGYTIERLPDDPAILFTADKDYNIVKDQAGAVQEVLGLMDHEPEPLALHLRHLLTLSARGIDRRDFCRSPG